MNRPMPGMLRCEDHSDTLSFHYNPTTVSVTKMVGWRGGAQRNAKRAPQQEFTGTKPGTLTLQLLFDAIDNEGTPVASCVQKLLGWSVPTEKSTHNHRPQPPVLVLQWGGTWYFPCRLKRIKAKYTLFDSNGTPVRATVDVSLVEVPHDPPPQNPTSGGITGRKSVRLGAGDSLPSLSYQEYGDPNLWRALAEANGIDDPLRLRPGDQLLIPSRPDAVRLSGAGHG